MQVRESLLTASHLLPDGVYLRLRYLQRMHRVLHLRHPRRFTEKLQWLKLHDHDLLYPTLVDKRAVKEYVTERIGAQYVLPTLGVWDRFEDIDFDALPERFVLKCTHDSGGAVLCPGRAAFDRDAAERKLRRHMNRNYYWHGREWPYRAVQPRILAEPYLSGPDGAEPVDYKLWCFHGKPELTLVCSGRFSPQGLREDFYDMAWNRLPLARPNHPNSEQSLPPPRHYGLMQRLAAELAGAFPFVRVDFYEVDGRVYFGEFTFYPASGLTGFVPEAGDDRLGQLLRLPEPYAERGKQ